MKGQRFSMAGTIRPRGTNLVLILDADPDPVTGRRRQKWETVKRLPRETDRQLRERAEARLAELVVTKSKGVEIALPRNTVEALLKRYIWDYVRPNLSPRGAEYNEAIIKL